MRSRTQEHITPTISYICKLLLSFVIRCLQIDDGSSASTVDVEAVILTLEPSHPVYWSCLSPCRDLFLEALSIYGRLGTRTEVVDVPVSKWNVNCQNTIYGPHPADLLFHLGSDLEKETEFLKYLLTFVVAYTIVDYFYW